MPQTSEFSSQGSDQKQPNDRKADGALKLGSASLQHVVGLSSFAIFPLLVAEAAGATLLEKAALFQISFLVLTIANVLQAANVGGVGIPHLVPGGYSAAYLAPSLLAARVGGLPL